jgi:hypothetical protein
MDSPATSRTRILPERGEPRHERCGVCGHEHACYATDRLTPGDASDAAWPPAFVCLGCLMRAVDPDAFAGCPDCALAA